MIVADLGQFFVQSQLQPMEKARAALDEMRRCTEANAEPNVELLSGLFDEYAVRGGRVALYVAPLSRFAVQQSLLLATAAAGNEAAQRPARVVAPTDHELVVAPFAMEATVFVSAAPLLVLSDVPAVKVDLSIPRFSALLAPRKMQHILDFAATLRAQKQQEQQEQAQVAASTAPAEVASVLSSLDPTHPERVFVRLALQIAEVAVVLADDSLTNAPRAVVTARAKRAAIAVVARPYDLELDCAVGVVQVEDEAHTSKYGANTKSRFLMSTKGPDGAPEGSFFKLRATQALPGSPKLAEVPFTYAAETQVAPLPPHRRCSVSVADTHACVSCSSACCGCSCTAARSPCCTRTSSRSGCRASWRSCTAPARPCCRQCRRSVHGPRRLQRLSRTLTGSRPRGTGRLQDCG
jgi:hypothetical protein